MSDLASDKEIHTDETSARARRPNVTLDQEAIALERSEQLRRNRSAAKGRVTRKIKELTELKLSLQDVNEARIKAQEFDDVIAIFYAAHDAYHATINNEHELEESDEYLEIETRRIQNFQQTLKEWIKKFTTEQSRSEIEIKSGDSVSNIGYKGSRRSRISASSSRRSQASSSAHSSLATAKAKKAALVAEAAALREHRALEEQELRLKQQELAQQQRQEEERLRLKQKKHQLQLETEIAKAEAEERVYAMAEFGKQYYQMPTSTFQSNHRYVDKILHPSYVKPDITKDYHPCQLVRRETDEYQCLPHDGPSTKENPKQGTNLATSFQPVNRHLEENLHPPDSVSNEYHDVQQQKMNLNTRKSVPPGEVDHPEVRKVRSLDDSEVAENFLHDMLDMQRQQQQQIHEMFQMQLRDNHLQQFLGQHHQWALSMTLPDAKVPVFGGDPVEYCHFIRSFENLIEAKTTSSNMRLYYLVQYTSGDVQELMRGCLSMDFDEGYQTARKLLKQRYGQSYRIATAYLDRITKLPQIKADDGEALQRFSVMLTSCKNTLKEIGFLGKLESPDNLQSVVNKLPYSLRQRWRDLADDIIYNKMREITFEDIAKFVEVKARASAHPVFGKVTSDSKNTGVGQDLKIPRRRFAFGIDGEVDQDVGNDTWDRNASVSGMESKPFKCPMCNGLHILPRCDVFKKETVENRLKLVRKKGLCYNCLFQGHIARSCPKGSFCNVSGCQVKHSTFLHPKGTSLREENPKLNESSTEGASENKDAKNGYVKANDSRRDLIGAGVSPIGLAIVPVKVKSRNSGQSILTYAFLDAGSNTTFCTNELLEKLGVKGEKTVLSLTTIQNENCPTVCRVVSLDVFDLDENTLVELPTVFSTSKLPVDESSIPCQTDVERWPHLKDVKITKIDARIGILIGNDAPRALEPKEIIECEGRGPYAVRTVFGWTINGPLGRNDRAYHSANYIRTDHTLSKQFERFCNLEFNDSVFDSKLGMSKEDSRAMSIIEGSVRLHNGHYEISLPWKNPSIRLPNNRPLAEHRLKLLKKRLLNKPEMLSKYAGFMDNLLSSGFARKVPVDLIDHPNGALWYLPHHPVFSPNKPNKIRVVFDCAAVYHGTSLNDQLLQGPDLTNNLFGVLTRFRQESVALMADIESMFHQVKVCREDCDALRFLWWPNNDLNSDPEEFQMLVHLFGATSSPSCANFALRKTADDNLEGFDEEVTDTVKRNFYVDDCLKSVGDSDKAIVLASDLRRLLAKGGFRLTKWVSNSSKVVASVPESERATSVKYLCFDEPSMERALGVLWNISSDEFGFKINVKDKPATRRGILSIVSSVYDPLGFASPFVLPAKILMQELCRKNLSWDDPIPADNFNCWKNWHEGLLKIQELRVPRCFKPAEFGEVTSSQLHHFSDASQRGYGAVSYLRLMNKNNDIHCSFVNSKSRLAPLKGTTIPRLELSAAVVATKLDVMIRKEIEIQIDLSLFWTDSTCVLGYISNADRRFQTFVANRIASIHEASSPSQWRYISTRLNPADDASRGLSADELINNKRWLSGPEFLWKAETYWPTSPSMSIQIPHGDPEIKREVQAFTTATNTDESFDVMFERFSSWERLKRFIAWLLRYRKNLRTASMKRKSELICRRNESSLVPISVGEMIKAEREIVRHVQRNSFQEEIHGLNKPVVGGDSKSCQTKIMSIKKSSSIYRLDPKLDGNLLCVGGRLRNAPIPEETKHPLILPKNHHISILIARHYHLLAGHSGLEHVLSLMREKFWIIGARAILKTVLNKCVDCRKRQAPTGEQKMADLPEHRVTPDRPPFSFVGVDSFGPFMIKRARSLVKRYGVLFTCMTVRAIHLEVAHSLDVDSFLHALRRFIARRGPPEVMRSDNGGNFVSGEKELRAAVADWNQEKVHQFLLQRNVKWIFNPPSGSHHGGIWERCIRTVRKVMTALLNQQTLDDEGLCTLMCEVESIINSRPLTKVSDDPDDLEALTPNHLLLLRSGSQLPPGVFRKEDLYTRRRWRQVQYLSDVFWRRWIKEYLPSLQDRQKWVKPRRNLAPGDIVLLVDENVARCRWPLGRVLEVKMNPHDGYVRTVTLKTKSTILERPVDKIVFLEATVL